MAAVETGIILRIPPITSGSLSFTFSLYRMDKQEEIRVKGSAEGIGPGADAFALQIAP